MSRRNLTRSRLSRHAEKQSKRTLLFSILGIAAVIIFIFQLGIPLLIRFSVLVGDVSQTAESGDQKKSSILVPPQLFPLPEATNSAEINVEGISSKDAVVEIFLNDKLKEKAETDEDGNFQSRLLTLIEGSNTIKARARDKDDTVSDFSPEISVTYDNSSPTLEIKNPSENQTVGKDEQNILVTGKTDEGTKVTVNGFWAVSDGSGNFSYNLPLSSGENTIIIEATDDAGNKTTVERKVTRSQ